MNKRCFSSSAQMVPGAVMWSNSDAIMTFQPSSPLPLAQTVYWLLSTGAKDKAGNFIGSINTTVFRVVF